jgi:chemotaxis protein CheC
MNPTNRQLDALKELINIGVGRGAEVLNTMLSSHIRLSIPFVRVLTPDAFQNEMMTLGSGQIAAVDLGFRGEFSGTAELIFPAETASKLVTSLTGEAPIAKDLDAIRAGTLCEIGNIVLNGVLGSISNILQLHFNYSVPDYHEGVLTSMWNFHDKDVSILLARTRFVVEQLEIEGDIILFFEVGALDTLLASIDGFSSEGGIGS